MKKCVTCANRDTGWCKGCEHNFPGVDQFDFYQEIKAEVGCGPSIYEESSKPSEERTLNHE